MDVPGRETAKILQYDICIRKGSQPTDTEFSSMRTPGDKPLHMQLTSVAAVQLESLPNRQMLEWDPKGAAGNANPLTFVDGNDVGVIEGRHYFNLSPDMDKILLILYFVFPDRLDSNLKMQSLKEKKKGKKS